MSDADVHVISTIENPGMVGGRFTGGSSDDSPQPSGTTDDWSCSTSTTSLAATSDNS